MAKAEKTIGKFRGRNMRFELYPDNSTHVRAMEMIRENFHYAEILHDKDLKEEPENDTDFKKAHRHFVVSFSNARANTAVCKQLGIESRFCLPCDDKEGALIYLIHGAEKDQDKYQYSVEEVSGDLKEDLYKALEKKMPEETKFVEILNVIDSWDGIIPMNAFLREMCRLGYFSVARRNASFIHTLVAEHNGEYYNKE